MKLSLRRWRVVLEPNVRVNSWLPLVLAGVALLTNAITPHRGWRILFVGLGLLWGVSWLWARSLARGLQVAREMRFGWAQVGDRLVERFALTNTGWAPALWVEVQDQSTMPEYRVSRGVGVASHDAIRWHTDAVCERRGVFMLGPIRLLTGDPFGLFAVTVPYQQTLPLLVLPPIVPLPSIEVAAGGRSGDARPRAYTAERTVSVAGVREYVPGDSRRWINWHVSARHDALYVRTFDGTPASDWWIVLDMERRVQVGSGQDATEEHGIILAASLADRGLRLRRAVGLATHGDPPVWLPPATGEGQRWELLRALAQVNSGTRAFAEMLQRVRPALGQRTSLILITPSTEMEWVATLLPLIQRGVTPTVLLLDPVSFGGMGNTAAIEVALQNLGVAHYRITKDVLNLPEKRPGQQGQWEWRVLGTGKAVPINAPADMPWRSLT